MMAKRSEATPTIIGSTTESTAADATAASIALPPCIRMRKPACAASGWLAATIPCCAMTSERDCEGHPSERSPRTALQNGGCGEEPHIAMAGTLCAQVPSAPRQDVSSQTTIAQLRFKY